MVDYKEERYNIMEFVPIIEIVRLENHPSFGTFGMLKINKTVFCATLEPPDRFNQLNISCIPTGQYICFKHKSPKFGMTYKVLNVPMRHDILFHAGNHIEDTEGCIIFGEHIGKLKGQRAVLNSGDTFKRFMDIMEDFKFFHLTIEEHF